MRKTTSAAVATACVVGLLLASPTSPALANPEYGYKNCTPTNQQGYIGTRTSHGGHHAWSNSSNGLNAYKRQDLAPLIVGYMTSGQNAAYWRRVAVSPGVIDGRYLVCTTF